MLLASGKSPFEPYLLMLQQATYSDVQVLIINQASLYYLAALAVAIGFRMNLFNIGLRSVPPRRDDDRGRRPHRAARRPAGAAAAARRHAHRCLLGRHRRCPEGHPGSERGRRDDHVSPTATSLIGYLTLDNIWGVQVGNNNTTGIMKKSGRVPGINLGSDVGEIYGLVFLAVLMGVLYWVVLEPHPLRLRPARHRCSETAAAASVSTPRRWCSPRC